MGNLPTTMRMFTLFLLLAMQLSCSGKTAGTSPDAGEDLVGPEDLVTQDHRAAGDSAADLIPGDIPQDLVTPEPTPWPGLAPVGPTIGSTLALSSHMSRSVEDSWKRTFELDRLQDLHIKRIRNDFRWKSVEPEDGAFNFDGHSVMVDRCLERGIQVTAILHDPREWATPEGSCDNITDDSWRDYVATTVSEFASRVNVWEVWNEPNLPAFWWPVPNPFHFGRILKAAYEEIHAGDDDAVVLLGGLNTFQFDPDGMWAFIDDLHTTHRDICDYFDALAIHPYTFGQLPQPEVDHTQGAWFHPRMTTIITLAREALARAGCPDKPIHLTEMGWPDLLTGQVKQAAYLARSLLLGSTLQVETYYWYTFWDGELTPDTALPTETSFGLFTYHYDGEGSQIEKPAYRAFKAIGELLDDYRFAGDLTAEFDWPEDQHALAYTNGQGGWILAVWHHGDDLEESRTVSIPAPSIPMASAVLYDQEGSSIRNLDSSSGPIEVELEGQVRYLAFSEAR